MAILMSQVINFCGFCFLLSNLQRTSKLYPQVVNTTQKAMINYWVKKIPFDVKNYMVFTCVFYKPFDTMCLVILLS